MKVIKITCIRYFQGTTKREHRSVYYQSLTVIQRTSESYTFTQRPTCETILKTNEIHNCTIGKNRQIGHTHLYIDGQSTAHTCI